MAIEFKEKHEKEILFHPLNGCMWYPRQNDYDGLITEVLKAWIIKRDFDASLAISPDTDHIILEGLRIYTLARAAADGYVNKYLAKKAKESEQKRLRELKKK